MVEQSYVQSSIDNSVAEQTNQMNNSAEEAKNIFEDQFDASLIETPKTEVRAKQKEEQKATSSN